MGLGRMDFSVSAPMRERLREYGGFHRTSGNEICHFIGIPSIVLGSATLLGLVPLVRGGGFTLTLAEVVAGCVMVFYVVSAHWLGVITALLLAGLVAFGRSLPVLVGAGFFVAGWIVQFVGHLLFEKTSPAFLKNLLHLLVGPAWLVERAFAKH
jgi:uncharacterized membrane protein YGL010W